MNTTPSTTRPLPGARAGFSLAELMVVIVILGLLATIVVPNVLSYLGRANSTIAKTDINAICNAIDNYMINNASKAPDNLEVLTTPDEHGERYIKVIPLDPWKNPDVYEPPMGGKDYRVISYGEDGVPGGEGKAQDIDNVTVKQR